MLLSCHPSDYFFVIPVLLLLSFQCSFFCHPSSPFFVIPVTISLSSQCVTLGSRKLNCK
ncbi:hypothetical protein [Wolbachia endosymbiont (group A) of Pogonocherus hispidulus]|uniref:hypothetical protein n=1 Tax=Wolbachia endosymbiont (group A) of Pogonocherus hispidulus TaxID=3066136 RepID=UPI00334005C0